MRQKIIKTLMIVPLVGICAQKINVDHNNGVVGNWHQIINEPIRNFLSPVLGEQYFRDKRWNDTPEYGLDTFGYLALVIFLPGFFCLYMVLRFREHMSKVELSIMQSYTVVLWWLFAGFLVAYNMTSTLPHIAGVLVFSLAFYILNSWE